MPEFCFLFVILSGPVRSTTGSLLTELETNVGQKKKTKSQRENSCNDLKANRNPKGSEQRLQLS